MHSDDFILPPLALELNASVSKDNGARA